MLSEEQLSELAQFLIGVEGTVYDYGEMRKELKTLSDRDLVEMWNMYKEV